MKKKIVVLGAGISGTATAFQLQQNGFEVIVLEKNDKAGGAMISEKESGYLIDYGPNSGLETTPVIREIVDAVGLKDEMIYASKQGNKRYILRNELLHELPANPPLLIKSKLFSIKGKLRLLLEPFIGKSNDGYYQSMSEFVTRRLGQEFLDYAINPFVAGVFAGNPDKLSVKSAFPKLYALEENYGGLIKGVIKGARERKKRKEKSKQNAKMFSFKNGMQAFPKAIAEKLDNVKYNCEVTKIEKRDNGYSVSYKMNDEAEQIDADMILSTLPAFIAPQIFSKFDEELKKHFDEIYYPPVLVLYLGFENSKITQTLDGFGFLIPEKEKKDYLGALWSSVIFENRADDDKASFTLFVGGARSPEIFEKHEDEIYSLVLSEFKQIMGIDSDPLFVKKRFWEKAIPQYNIGYIEHENYFERFENENPGIFLSGNYRGGISVGDCIKNSEIVTKRIIKFASNN